MNEMRKLIEAVEMAQTANPRDEVTLDIPLLIRLLEFSRDDAQTDQDLHSLTDNMINLSPEGSTLTMADYEELVAGLAGNEEIAYDPQPGDDEPLKEPTSDRLSDDESYGVGGLIDQGR